MLITILLERLREMDSLKGLVYFISAADDNSAVKIGVTVGCAFTRMTNIQACSPLSLRLLGVTKGGRVGEAFWHQVFDEHRFRGEWFDLSDVNLREFFGENPGLKDIPIQVRNSLPMSAGYCSCVDCELRKIYAVIPKRKLCERCHVEIEAGRRCATCEIKEVQRVMNGVL